MDAKKLFKEWILPLGLELIALVLIVKFVFFLVIVPTGSMIPAIDEGSLLFAFRVHDTEKLERGDIIVFKSEELGKNLVKRLVGLPGEAVSIEDGQVYIDDVPLEEDYVQNHSYEDDYFLVPEGCYLFLGDNRSGSADARYWEEPYIDGKYIMGRAVFTLWPLSNFGSLN